MALIVIHHTVVDAFDVDPSFQVNSSNRILQGTLVGLNAQGFLAKSGTSVSPLGIAGDSISDEYRESALSSDLVISPTGAKRWTSNRVSDMYNETLASGKMSVYFGSGKFATDQYVLTDNFLPGLPVYSDANGLFTVSTGTSARVVGYVTAAPSDYPSGVPGVDSPSVDNSMSLGEFLTVHLAL